MLTRYVREPANGLTHLAGVLLALTALPLLLSIGIHMGNLLALIGLGIFGLSQIALYTASTLHHSLNLTARGRRRLLKFDLAMIVVLIAGTYTPLCLIALHGAWRWGLLSAVWGLALGGFIWMCISINAPRWFSTSYFVLLGWVGLIAVPVIVHTLPRGGAICMFVGGVIYTVGALVFLLDRPRLFPGIFGAHALWHVFVLGGSIACFFLVVRYIVPLA